MHQPGPLKLPYMYILVFWTPLAVMWILMGFEQPALTAVAARLPDAALNLAAFGVTARVVDATSPRRSLGAVIVGHVGLGADDRLDALSLALLVELQGAVHVAVIGDADRRLAVADRFGHHLIEARCTVEHREFGVDVEMSEAV